MRGIKTEKITLTNIKPSDTLSTIFDQAKSVLKQAKRLPLRLVLLQRKNREASLLVSFVYDRQNEK